jgi:YVTN family beta-propeller protein
MAVETAAGEVEPAQFHILGPLEVVRSGCAVPLGGPRQRAVLALLLLEANRVVSVDRLAEDVWGGHPPPGSVTTLHSYVFRLRRALEPDRLHGVAGDVLVTRDRGYLLRVNREHLDAAMFEEAGAAGRAALEAGRYAEAAQALRTALGLWRGPVLADLADYGFARPEAARLEELRLAAVEDRIDADLALGRHQALTGELERLASEYPLRERLHGQLMLALYRCGRQAEALAAYRRVRDLLTGELGIDPAEPLRRLHASVLAHDPALEWNGGRLVSADDDRAGAGAPAVSPPPGPAAVWSAAGGGERDWARRRARRLLAAGSALAVAAAVSIVVVARPWAGESTDLPGNAVGLIDSGGGRVGAPVSVGTPDGLAYGVGSVWGVDSADNTLFRIDPATHAVIGQIPVGADPAAVTVTRGGNVWVANSGDGTVSRVNATAGKVVQTIGVGNVPAAIAAGPGGVWVANQGDGTVDRINAVTGSVTMRDIPVGAGPDGIAVGPHAVWVANGQDGTVTRIDPATGQPSGPIFVGAGPAGIAITPSAVWVANSLDLSVWKIDPVTGQVAAIFRVGDGPHAIVAGSDGVWVGDEFDATLAHIDPGTGQVRKTFVGSSPHGLAITRAGVWVAARPFALASHRGGTLTVVTQWLPQLDPTQAGGTADLPALATVYDGLVALRRSGGAQGFTLVPDLAITLPHPTDGGTTYTFSIRRDIRYSTGALVRASDFRRGIQRELTFGANPGYYEGILGAPACQQHPQQCDLSAGIATNDAAGTVTFHLTQPDPDFLDKLALLLAVPAPPGAPGRVIDRAYFLPGTGPYKIAQYQPSGPYRIAQYRLDASLTLVRNPYFRQWSYAAQPAGYPDVIRLKRIADPKKLESAVTTGTADMVDLNLNGLPSHDLAVRYPTRLYSGPKVGTTYVFLNTRQLPFSNLRARQAVSYAIDRARMVRLADDGPGEASVTCQVLPADFPGYRPYCPYTTGVKDGFWHGPDMTKALRLVKASHTTNVPVTVWNYPGVEGAYLVSLLRDLGYRATLHTVSAEKFYRTIGNARRKIQTGLISWGADFPAPSTFFLPSLTCQSFYESPAYTVNYAEYCDPRVDKLATEAQAEQLTDPATARTLWAQVDRAVTDQAPWVPVFNGSWTVFVSSRVGNSQVHANYGPLLDQMWVR